MLQITNNFKELGRYQFSLSFPFLRTCRVVHQGTFLQSRPPSDCSEIYSLTTSLSSQETPLALVEILSCVFSKHSGRLSIVRMATDKKPYLVSPSVSPA